MSAGDAEIRDALFMADEIANCRRKRGEEGALEESSYGFRMTKEEVIKRSGVGMFRKRVFIPFQSVEFYQSGVMGL